MTHNMRRPTKTESLRLLYLAALLKNEIDAELGTLYERAAIGDVGAFPAIHDRFNVLGRPDLADTIRGLMENGKAGDQQAKEGKHNHDDN